MGSDPICNCTINDKFCPDRSSAELIWKIVPSILLCFGTIGNILSICVLRSPTIRKSVCSIYLIALSVSDLLVLYTGLFRYWIIGVFAFDVRDFNSVSCKLYSFFIYFFLDVSSWILVAITIERVFLVWFPFKTKAKCNKKVAVASLIFITVLLFLVNIHIVYGRELNIEHSNGSTTTVHKKCRYISDNYKHFFKNVWPSIDFIVFSGAPLIFLCIGNILIFLKVCISRRASRRQITTNRSSNNKNKQTDSRFSSMTVILITINTMFLLCNTPISAFFIGREIWMVDSNVFHCAKLYLVQTVCNFLMYLNNSVNFLLYVASGSRFRKAFVAMVTKSPTIMAPSENLHSPCDSTNKEDENAAGSQNLSETQNDESCSNKMSASNAYLHPGTLKSQESDSQTTAIFHIEQTDDARSYQGHRAQFVSNA